MARVSLAVSSVRVLGMLAAILSPLAQDWHRVLKSGCHGTHYWGAYANAHRGKARKAASAPSAGATQTEHQAPSFRFAVTSEG